MACHHFIMLLRRPKAQGRVLSGEAWALWFTSTGTDIATPPSTLRLCLLASPYSHWLLVCRKKGRSQPAQFFCGVCRSILECRADRFPDLLDEDFKGTWVDTCWHPERSRTAASPDRVRVLPVVFQGGQAFYQSTRTPRMGTALSACHVPQTQRRSAAPTSARSTRSRTALTGSGDRVRRQRRWLQ